MFTQGPKSSAACFMAPTAHHKTILDNDQFNHPPHVNYVNAQGNLLCTDSTFSLMSRPTMCRFWHVNTSTGFFTVEPVPIFSTVRYPLTTRTYCTLEYSTCTAQYSMYMYSTYVVRIEDPATPKHSLLSAPHKAKANNQHHIPISRLVGGLRTCVLSAYHTRGCHLGSGKQGYSVGNTKYMLIDDLDFSSTAIY